MVRVYLQKGLNIIQYNCVIFFRVYAALFLLEYCRTFLSINNCTMEHPRGQLRVLMLQAIRAVSITTILLYCNE
jgi:hypothetical protein